MECASVKKIISWFIIVVIATGFSGKVVFATGISRCMGFGIVSAFNVFVLGNDTQKGTEVGGALAVGGDASFSGGMGVGTALKPSTTRRDLIVGGNLSFNGGSVAGVIIYGGSYTKGSSVYSNGAFRGHPINFRSAAQALRQVTTTWSKRQVNGGTIVSRGGQISFTGTDPNFDVFAVSGAVVANARSLSIKVPSGATTLINVSGPVSQLSNGSLSLSGASADNVIWNFYQATRLSISGIRVGGSVFAPKAAIFFDNGHIDGMVVAGSLEGGGESGDTLFHGCVPFKQAASW